MSMKKTTEADYFSIPPLSGLKLLQKFSILLIISVILNQFSDFTIPSELDNPMIANLHFLIQCFLKQSTILLSIATGLFSSFLLGTHLQHKDSYLFFRSFHQDTLNQCLDTLIYFFQEYDMLIFKIQKENLTKEEQTEILNRILISFAQLYKTMEKYSYRFASQYLVLDIYTELQEIYNFSREITLAIPLSSIDTIAENGNSTFFNNIFYLYQCKNNEYRQIYDKILKIQTDYTNQIHKVYANS